jgi:acetyltransferase
MRVDLTVAAGGANVVPLPAPDTVLLSDGRRAIVRPMWPQDAAAEESFFADLSTQSSYRRFLFAVRALPEAVLRLLTEIDLHRHVALVALADESADGEEALTIVADARYVRSDDGCDAETAVAVADDWQGIGLGTALMRRLAEHARQAGVRRLHGDILADNGPIRALVQRLGGRIEEHPQDARLCRAAAWLSQVNRPSQTATAPLWAAS